MDFKRNIIKKRDWVYPMILLCFGGILIRLSLPLGYVFGSETDWFCQHVALADYMRKEFFATGRLLPDFSGLGGGSNFYDLSYYGLLRPDVLLSYFLPKVSVASIIQGYAIFEVLLGAQLLYVWLRRKKLGALACLTAGILYLCANCMFQAHRQIMFVNDLPFVTAALLSIDKLLEMPPCFSWYKPHIGLVLSFFMIIIHSYYFFPACFAACSLYFWFRTQELKGRLGVIRLWGNYLISAAASVCLAMVILLPTGLAILENKKDVKSVSLLQLLTVNPSLDSLLYSAYGCGLTVLCLYTLFLGIRRIRTRGFALWLLCFLSCGIFHWILNGTLYVRPKCMIPFLPLILYLVALALDELWAGKIKHSVGIALCGVIVAVQIIFFNPGKNIARLMVADWGIVVIYAIFQKIQTFRKNPSSEKGTTRYSRNLQCVLLCTLPALLFLAKAETEQFVSKEEAAAFSHEEFTAEELSQLCQSHPQRLDFLSKPLTNTNYAAFGGQHKSTLYSSVSNSDYNHLYYDILKMPISIRNRVAMTGGENPIQEYLMGVRYLLTAPDRLPTGYEVLEKRDNLILTENKNVLPLAYGSTALIDEAMFDRLSFPQNLDTLANRTVVPDSPGFKYTDSSVFSEYRSRMKAYPLPRGFFYYKTSTGRFRRMLGNRTEACGETALTLPLPSPLSPATLLLLSFDVDYRGSEDVSVTINGIKNCLSGKDAPYPNRNTTFTYMISENSPISELDVHFSKGNYRISNVSAYTLPLSALDHPDITPFQFRQAQGKEILNGSVSMKKDGYFVTSFAFSHGYQAFVDGQKVTPVQVNKGFVGFPITKGTHEILLKFHAPGKTAGLIISLLAACYLFFTAIWSQLRTHQSKRV